MRAYDIAQMIDFATCQTTTTLDDVKSIAKYAKKYHFKAVGCMTAYIPYLKEYIADDPSIILCGGTGFPSGCDPTSVKVFAAKELVEQGCKEMDMVINVGFIRSGMFEEAYEDVHAVKETIGDVPLKVILETNYLTADEIRRACDIVVRANGQFVKTGTGWSGASKLGNVRIMKETVGDACEVKVAGGVPDLDTLLAFYEAGATRFGIGNGAMKPIEGSTAIQIMEAAIARFGE